MTPLALSIDEAAKMLSIGKTKLYAELSAGRLEGKKLGKRTLVTRESIENWLANLESYPSQSQTGGAV